MTDFNRDMLRALFIVMFIALIVLCITVNYADGLLSEVVAKNELLRAELIEYNGTTKLFPNHCIKCYCKEICQEDYSDTGVEWEK